MSRNTSARWGRWTGFPRVSGDEPEEDITSMEVEMFSPRERG